MYVLKLNLKKNKKFLVSLLVIFILYMITYPSVHNLTDEELYLNLSKEVCKGNFSFYSEDAYRNNTLSPPIYFISLCLTSPFHKYNIAAAELTTFLFTLMMVVGWYFSLPESMDKKSFVVLFFSNALIWTYSFRVLIDLPMAAFLSLGLFQFYLYLENNNKKNCTISLVLLSLAVLTRELSLIYIPILFAYMIVVKRIWNPKMWMLLTIPLLPYIIYMLTTGSLEIMDYFTWALGEAEERTADYYSESKIPYKSFPVMLFMLGSFGPGFISCLYMWKNSAKDLIRYIKTFFMFSGGKVTEKPKNQLMSFVMFSLMLYLIWEVVFDVLPFKSPRFNITLVPFLTLLISESSRKNKKMKYIYYLTLIYSIALGFTINYYFHLEAGSIWQDSISEIIKKLLGRN